MKRHVSSIADDVAWVANQIARLSRITHPHYVAWEGATEKSGEWCGATVIDSNAHF